jgi:hypothetical protein
MICLLGAARLKLEGKKTINVRACQIWSHQISSDRLLFLAEYCDYLVAG